MSENVAALDGVEVDPEFAAQFQAHEDNEAAFPQGPKKFWVSMMATELPSDLGLTYAGSLAQHFRLAGSSFAVWVYKGLYLVAGPCRMDPFPLTFAPHGREVGRLVLSVVPLASDENLADAIVKGLQATTGETEFSLWASEMKLSHIGRAGTPGAPNG